MFFSQLSGYCNGVRVKEYLSAIAQILHRIRRDTRKVLLLALSVGHVRVFDPFLKCLVKVRTSIVEGFVRETFTSLARKCRVAAEEDIAFQAC